MIVLELEAKNILRLYIWLLNTVVTVCISALYRDFIPSEIY